MSLLINESPVTRTPMLGEAVKICLTGETVDGKEFKERFFVTIKHLPSEENDYQFVGIISNKLIYSPLKLGQDIHFKQEHILELSGRIHSIEASLAIFELFKADPKSLQALEKLAKRL